MVEAISTLKEISQYTLLAVAIVPLWLRRRLKEEVSGDPDDPDLEIAHEKDRFLGGGDESTNVRAVSRVSHYFDHQKKADKAKNEVERKIHKRAMELIKERMTKEERGQV